MVIIMSFWNYISALSKQGIKKFIGVVTLANRSYYMDDYFSDTTTDNPQGYRVGQANLSRNGSQTKQFVSKSTAIMCTEDVYVIFNHSDNVIHLLQADTWFIFKQDLRLIIYYDVDTAGTIYIHCEGVLSQEGRVEH